MTFPGEPRDENIYRSPHPTRPLSLPRRPPPKVDITPVLHGKTTREGSGGGGRFMRCGLGVMITGMRCITQLKAQGPSRTCNESKEGCEHLGGSVGLHDLPGRPYKSGVCGPYYVKVRRNPVWCADLE